MWRLNTAPIIDLQLMYDAFFAMWLWIIELFEKYLYFSNSLILLRMYLFYISSGFSLNSFWRGCVFFLNFQIFWFNCNLHLSSYRQLLSLLKKWISIFQTYWYIWRVLYILVRTFDSVNNLRNIYNLKFTTFHMKLL